MQPVDSCGLVKSQIRNLKTTLVSMLLIFNAADALADNTEEVFTRDASSSLTRTVELSQDEYRTEAYEDTYIERVAYEDVEWYTDYETYYEDEQVCDNVPVTETECRTERQCRSVPVRECTQREVCRDTPRGEICRPVNDCTTRYEERCSNERICEDRTRYEYRCWTERVEKTREVQRQRTVTRYRDEERCCVTRYRDVYDHTWNLPVVVEFPSSPKLIGDESETITVRLQGPESNPSARIWVNSDIFHYEIDSEGMERGSYKIALRMVPHLTEEQLGRSTIESLKLKPSRTGAASAEFMDSSAKPRVNSTYDLQVMDRATGEMVARKTWEGEGENHVIINLGEALAINKDYDMNLGVRREGINVVSPVEFAIDGGYTYKRLDPSKFDESSMLAPRFSRRGNTLKAFLSDSGVAEDVDTIYNMTLVDRKTGAQVATMTTTPAELEKDREGRYILEFNIRNHKESDFNWILSVNRTSLFLEQEIQFEKTGAQWFHIDLAPYKNESLVGSIDIEGTGNAAVLSFKDQTNPLEALDTVYEIEIWRKSMFSSKKVIATKTIQRSEIAGNKELVKLSILRDLDGNSSRMREYIKSRKKIRVKINVKRYDLREGEQMFKNFVRSKKVKI